MNASVCTVFFTKVALVFVFIFFFHFFCHTPLVLSLAYALSNRSSQCYMHALKGIFDRSQLQFMALLTGESKFVLFEIVSAVVPEPGVTALPNLRQINFFGHQQLLTLALHLPHCLRRCAELYQESVLSHSRVCAYFSIGDGFLCLPFPNTSAPSFLKPACFSPSGLAWLRRNHANATVAESIELIIGAFIAFATFYSTLKRARSSLFNGPRELELLAFQLRDRFIAAFSIINWVVLVAVFYFQSASAVLRICHAKHGSENSLLVSVLPCQVPNMFNIFSFANSLFWFGCAEEVSSTVRGEASHKMLKAVCAFQS